MITKQELYSALINFFIVLIGGVGGVLAGLPEGATLAAVPAVQLAIVLTTAMGAALKDIHTFKEK